MKPALNKTQLEILKLFSNNQSEEDLKEIKSLLIIPNINYKWSEQLSCRHNLSDKGVREADKTTDAKQYTQETFEKWKPDHSTKSA